MAKAPNKSEQHSQAFEVRPDGWAQFELAVDAAVKSGPKHKAAKADKAGRKSNAKRRVSDDS